jgi:hypothetical protein
MNTEHQMVFFFLPEIGAFTGRLIILTSLRGAFFASLPLHD